MWERTALAAAEGRRRDSPTPVTEWLAARQKPGERKAAGMAAELRTGARVNSSGQTVWSLPGILQGNPDAQSQCVDSILYCQHKEGYRFAYGKPQHARVTGSGKQI